MKVAAELRLKHGVLRELAIKYGGTKALAKEIGIGMLTVHKWLHMKGCPSPGEYNRWYTKEVEERLEELAGCSAHEIFPPGLKEFTATCKKTPVQVCVKDIEPLQLLSMAESANQRMITCDPRIELESQEASEHLHDAMNSLEPRQQIVLKKRFFEGKTLEICASEMGVSRARVSQIELKALRVLKEGRFSSKIAAVCPELAERLPNFEKLDRERKQREKMTLREIVDRKVAVDSKAESVTLSQ